MQFKAFESGIEVNGQTVYSIVAGLGGFERMAHGFLLDVGIGSGTKTDYHIDKDGWYSQEKWLEAFEKISKEVGNATLKQIGMKIPENAIFPPWVKDIDSAIRSIDIAYHMNHRKNKVVMFDPNSGKMLEGIGHYGYERVAGKNMIISECKNPYPHAFDWGIISTMAGKFEKTASVDLDESKPNRAKGGESSTYLITW